mmetsp:Transcript_14977/g.29143  ORF Transcript_14977/g.29143 Transcript_14977/m.29143 type:complete len:86 (-) Transcript_14977:425-682(-)
MGVVRWYENAKDLKVIIAILILVTIIRLTGDVGTSPPNFVVHIEPSVFYHVQIQIRFLPTERFAYQSIRCALPSDASYTLCAFFE